MTNVLEQAFEQMGFDTSAPITQEQIALAERVREKLIADYQTKTNIPKFNGLPVNPIRTGKYDDILDNSHRSAVHTTSNSLFSDWEPSDFADLAVVLFGSILGIWLAVKFIKRLKSLAAAQRAIAIAASTLIMLLVLAWPSIVEKRYDGRIMHREVSIDPIWDEPVNHYIGPDIKTVIVYLLASTALGTISFALARQRQQP